MTRHGDGLQRMILIPESTYKSLCSNNESAPGAAAAAADVEERNDPTTGVLDGPRDALGKNLVEMQQQLHELDGRLHPADATRQLQRSQLESKLLNARRAFLQPASSSPVEREMASPAPETRFVDASGVPKALRGRFQRLAARVFPEDDQEDEPMPANELTQQEVKDLMEYVVRDKPLKRQAKRPPNGLQKFLDFLRKRDIDPSLVGKHVREDLREQNSDSPMEDTAAGDNSRVDMQMLEDYETLA